MALARSAGVFIGTDETTGVTVSNNTTTSPSETDMLGDDTSTGYLFLYVKFTSTVTGGTLDLKISGSRVSGQAYTDAAPVIWSIPPISGTQKVDIARLMGGPLWIGRRVTVSITNSATGASATNVTVGYELVKVS